MICEKCGKEIHPELQMKRLIMEHNVPFYCSICYNIDFPLKPVRDLVYLWVKPIPEKIGNFWIPEAYRENDDAIKNLGVVLASGRGWTNKKGKFTRNVTKEGDFVLFYTNPGWVMEIPAPDGKLYPVAYMPECDVKGILFKEDTIDPISSEEKSKVVDDMLKEAQSGVTETLGINIGEDFDVKDSSSIT